MKRILLLLVLCLNISMVLGQEYKNWEKYDIEGFYIIAKSKAEAKISKNVLREGADYYILTEMDDQVFPSGVSKKITPKLYKLKDTEIYIFFSFPPFLFDADNGMIEMILHHQYLHQPHSLSLKMGHSLNITKSAN